MWELVLKMTTHIMTLFLALEITVGCQGAIATAIFITTYRLHRFYKCSHVVIVTTTLNAM